MFADNGVALPAYDFDACLPSPAYSACAGSSERLLQFEPSGLTGCPPGDWTMETKHMKINMGPRVWGLTIPSYGLNGKVEGSILFSGNKNGVESVTATLEGYLKTSLSHRGSFSGDSILLITSHTTEIYNSICSESVRWDQKQLFSIPIPSKVKICGQNTLTPPSFFSYHQNVSCEISYTVKFHMIRRAKGLKRNEIKLAQILYLPKSRPIEPPLAAIPRPSRRHDDASQFFKLFARVKTVALSPYHPPFCKVQDSVDPFSKSVYLSLPSPQCFTSGESIPFTLCFAFPENPFLASLLTRNARIQLIKRLSVMRKGLSEPVERDTFVSSAQLWSSKEYAKGVCLLRGMIQAGSAGEESSWKIEGVSALQYVLRLTLHPPDCLEGHIPSFRHEEVLQITTDYWGTLDRELNAIGGTPTPALGLARNLRHGS